MKTTADHAGCSRGQAAVDPTAQPTCGCVQNDVRRRSDSAPRQIGSTAKRTDALGRVTLDGDDVAVVERGIRARERARHRPVPARRSARNATFDAVDRRQVAHPARTPAARPALRRTTDRSGRRIRDGH